MSLPIFPPNPEDNTVFEITEGTYYIYSAGSNSWNRFDGIDSLGLATPLEPGLMSKEDFSKLNSLLIPPPQVSIQGEECQQKFSTGTVGLYSFDESINILSSLDILNKVNGVKVEESTPWSLHKNTAALDFTVNVNNLLSEIESRGLLSRVQIQGDTGDKGKKGEAGESQLDTGPVGETGLDGANSPFGGSIVTESIPFEKVDASSNKAIVSLAVSSSNGESKLVATRANIGNPDACPNQIIPNSIDSELLVVLNTITGGKLVKNQVVQSSSGDCSLICRVCSSTIHHLNIESLLSDLNDKFNDRIRKLKADKEELVKAWLKIMIELFNQQKQALCCALENCRSRGRNKSTREYIESQRIQAAIGDFRLTIDGANDKEITKMDSFKDCPVPQQPANSIIITDDGVIFNLDAKIHIVDPRTGNSGQSLTTFLSAGTYIAEITDCCANFDETSKKYSGHTALLYKAVTQVDSKTTTETKLISFPNLGDFTNLAAAKNAYNGVTISFEHGGGDVSVWLLDPDGFIENNSGGVQITITSATAAGGVVAPVGSVFVYREDISSENYVGRILPFSGVVSAAANLNITDDGNVNPISGSTLSATRASTYFYNGSDGLYMFFTAGALPASDNDPGQDANLDINVQIENQD